MMHSMQSMQGMTIMHAMSRYEHCTTFDFEA